MANEKKKARNKEKTFYLYTHFYSVIKIVVFNVMGNCHEHFFYSVYCHCCCSAFNPILSPKIQKKREITYTIHRQPLHHKYMKNGKVEVFGKAGGRCFPGISTIFFFFLFC